MSTETETNQKNTEHLPKPPDQYTGPQRYIEWIEDYLDLYLSETQKEIIETVTTNKKTLIYGANGFGKSYAISALSLAFLFTNLPSTVLATSGTYRKLKRTLCKPIENLHKKAKKQYKLPGRYKQSPPRIEFDDLPNWFFEAARPVDAGELEGTHNEHLLAVIEEADKPKVTRNVLDSMDSLLTDDRDRLVAVANPPRDETDIVYSLIENPNWKTLQYSSFDSHNVQIETNNLEAEKIDGLVSLSKIKENWQEWNEKPWPGIKQAQQAHKQQETLDTRWYRRRAGVMPSVDSKKHRPFYPANIKIAYRRNLKTPKTPRYIGIDIARSGDHTVATGLYGNTLKTIYADKGTNHNQQRLQISKKLRAYSNIEGIAVDAVGEGSGFADELDTEFPNVYRYKSGSKPTQKEKYRYKWEESLKHFGEFIKNGSIESKKLREEALIASRTIEYETHTLQSRGGEVLKATSKEEIKDSLNRSPDFLDSALMCIWLSKNKDKTTSTGMAPPVIE